MKKHHGEANDDCSFYRGPRYAENRSAIWRLPGAICSAAWSWCLCFRAARQCKIHCGARAANGDLVLDPSLPWMRRANRVSSRWQIGQLEHPGNVSKCIEWMFQDANVA